MESKDGWPNHFDILPGMELLRKTGRALLNLTHQFVHSGLSDHPHGAAELLDAALNDEPQQM